MEVSDKTLIEAYRQGEADAFGKLVCRHGDSLLGYLTKISNNRDAAEDLFQETFKRVHEKIHTLKTNNFRSWLFRIATNLAVDGYRRQKRFSFVSLNQKPDYDGDSDKLPSRTLKSDCPEPPAEAAVAELKEKVRSLIVSLPEKQKVILVLSYYEQLSHNQVAEIVGCSIGTVKRQMYRALRTLAAKLPVLEGGLQ